ncbi:acyl-CoA thioesterase [Trujillonella endophytica]|uniref:Acyl-CoA thioester hydrolase n=1 Tax=Trujillonella endophytica TaxID=673521 RepID=A0A1H8QIA2_9ACTN|nr:thioesterase family protein [Trujillella endophytica]SEO53949.1 acyl-CoA thioester hydrolase [Trujillella endophytica]
MSDSQLSFQLSYGDCDTVGIAYFAIYYPWMERAYSTWLYSHGLRSGELAEQHGFTTVGVHSECTYKAMVRVFDELDVRLVLDRVGSSSYTVGFDFVRAGEVVTHGTMTFVCRTLEGGKATIPEVLMAVLRTLPAAEGAAG